MRKKESTNKSKVKIGTVYNQLGAAIADTVTHPDCPVWLNNELNLLVSEAINRASTAKSAIPGLENYASDVRSGDAR